MTTSVQKDALLSQFADLAYKQSDYLDNPVNLPTGWKLVDAKVEPPFAGFAFRNTTTGEIVVSYRGVDGVNDGSVAKDLLTGDWNPQFQKGMDFLERIGNRKDLFPNGFDKSQLLVTGHSLGGAIAQIVAYAYGLDGSTIDPAGAARIITEEGFRLAAAEKGLTADSWGIPGSFTNHLVVDSTISGGTGPQLGQVSYVPSLTFTSAQAWKIFAAAVLNPLAGFAYAIATDQIANKHSSEQISQALQLMAGAGDAGNLGPDALILVAKIIRYDTQDDGTSKPVYSQTEFEIRNKAGEFQNTVKFSGTGADRKFEIFDPAGALKSTTTLASSGAVTVQPVLGSSVVIAYLPESHANEDGTITTTTRALDGTTTSVANRIVYDDGSSIEATTYTNGRTITTVRDEDNQKTSDTWQNPDGTHGTDTFYPATGASSGTIINPDDSSTNYSDDGHGSVRVSDYTPGGVLTGHRWQNADGSRGSEAFKPDGTTIGLLTRADGSFQRYSDDGKGNISINEYARNGQPTSSSWWKADHSHGSEVVAADGSRRGTAHGADGSYVNYTSDRSGNTKSSTAYDAQGKFLASQWRHADGSSGGVTINTNEGPDLGATVVLFKDGQGGTSTTIYRFNGSVTGQILNMAGTGITDDGQGLRIETQYGPGGLGIVSNTHIRYNPDGSGTSTTTDDSGRVTEKTYGPGELAPLQKPDTPDGAPEMGGGYPQCPAPSDWLPSDPSGEPLDGPPLFEGLDIPGDGEFTIATREDGETVYTDAAGNTYILNGTQLTINDSLVIKNWVDGDLGIVLDDKAPQDPLLKAPFDTAAKTTSPIVLDLDGNGIATRGINGGAYFDYDGNGYAERTGWVNPGDSLLVRDLNHDGKISTAAELFGNQTRLQNNQLAANGYAALADLDDNGDDKVDSHDAAWGELMIWQDANSDGINQRDEMKNLAALGIESLATNYTSATSTDGNGNQHRQQGTYSKTDGSTGQSEDLWFVTNPSISRQNNPLAISDTLRALPEIRGSGNVASLRQVMAQQAANGSSHLQELLQQFASETDATARYALVVAIIYSWTGVEDKDPASRAATQIYGNAIGDARKLYAMEALVGEGYLGTWCWQEKDPNPHGPASAILLKAFDEFANTIAAQLMQQMQFGALYNAITYSFDRNTQTVKGDLAGTLPIFAEIFSTNHDAGIARLAEFITNLTYTNRLSQFDTRAFQEALAIYGADVLSAANMAWRGMVATQGNDRLLGDGTNEVINGWGGNDQIEGAAGDDRLLGEAGGDRLYGQSGNDTLDGGGGDDLLDGGAGSDVYLFGRGSGKDTIYSQDSSATKLDTLRLGVGVSPSHIDLLRNADDLILTIRDTGDRITATGYFSDDGTSPSRLDCIAFEDGTTWTFASVKAMLSPTGSEVSDRIRGYNTVDVIDGLGGDDVIEGMGGDDSLRGGSGNDTLNGGAGNDSLDGGAGDDTLSGETGNDTYLFGKGDGHDFIGYDDDTAPGKLNVLQFKSGVLPSDVLTTRSGNDLLLSIVGTGDKITLQHFFYTDDPASSPYNPVQLIKFADGGTLDFAKIMASVIVGNDTAQTLTGYATADVINAAGGNDTISGMGGNDTLDGGTGDDTLSGGTGNDTYLFGKGDSQDTIGSDYDTAPGKLNVLQFKSGVLPNEVVTTRSGSDLVLSIVGTSDKITLQRFFSTDDLASNLYNPVQLIKFADGSILDLATIMTGVIVGNDTAQTLIAYATADVINAAGGNDTVFGMGGNDTLDGGAGNDKLYGDSGNDTSSAKAMVRTPFSKPTTTTRCLKYSTSCSSRVACCPMR